MDFILISSIDWDFLWQTHQEIATRLAGTGHRVLYVETTGVRSPGLRDAGRVTRRILKWARGLREVAPGIHVLSPLAARPFGKPWERVFNRRLLTPVVARAARRLGMSDPVFWTFLPSETTLDLVRALRTSRGAVVYHCLADFELLASDPDRLSRSEQALLQESDLVFTQCSYLARRCSRWAYNVHLLRPGVNLETFIQPPPVALDPDDSSRLQALPRPIVGFVGGLHRHVDLDLLTSMAQARSDWSFVFVGPLQIDVAPLAWLPNVHFLGHRAHRQLAACVDAFDVCIVPYRVDSFTAAIVPTKVNEYLAMGKPVVSTRLASLERSEVIVTAPSEPAAFIAAIERALAGADNPELRARRRAVAAESDWRSQFEKAWVLLESVVSQPAPAASATVLR